MLLVRDGRVRNIVRGGAPGYELMGESIGFLKLSRLGGVAAARAARGARAGRRHRHRARGGVSRAAGTGGVGFERVDGLPWIEIDFPDDVARAEREVLPRIEALRDA